MHLDLRERWQPLFPSLLAEASAAGLRQEIEGVNSQTDQTIVGETPCLRFEKPRGAVRSAGMGSAPIAPHSAQYNELACALFRRPAPLNLRCARKRHVFLVGNQQASLAPELLSICRLELKMNFNSVYEQGSTEDIDDA